MSRHHTVRLGINAGPERHQLPLKHLVIRLFNYRQMGVGVLRCVAMPRKMFKTDQQAMAPKRDAAEPPRVTETSRRNVYRSMRGARY